MRNRIHHYGREALTVHRPNHTRSHFAAKWKLKASEKPFKVVAEGATKCDDSTDL
ncbi:hypothetical protein JHK82_048719 [Glycine max]|nr:hypothetical protein JHK82_048719 [Glycine max]